MGNWTWSCFIRGKRGLVILVFCYKNPNPYTTNNFMIMIKIMIIVEYYDYFNDPMNIWGVPIRVQIYTTEVILGPPHTCFKVELLAFLGKKKVNIIYFFCGFRVEIGHPWGFILGSFAPNSLILYRHVLCTCFDRECVFIPMGHFHGPRCKQSFDILTFM